MTARFFLTTDAKKDLIEIRDYTLSQWGNEQSKKYIKDLSQTLSLLSQNPLMRLHRTDIDENVYSFSYASHVVYYLTKDKRLIVFGVLHKSMVPENHLPSRQR